MPQELTTQEQFDAFAADVARELGTHCRTAPLPAELRDTARLIVDDDGRALRLVQPDRRRPERLRVYAALPDESQVRRRRSGSRQAAPGTWRARSSDVCHPRACRGPHAGRRPRITARQRAEGMRPPRGRRRRGRRPPRRGSRSTAAP
ncbi:hypothetical protein LV779_22030 [Streptomyces thinghirensis]|nr:hypothetical protein [Streptomyces thinghirensis]